MSLGGANITGTFLDPLGNPREGQIVTFTPLSTPFAHGTQVVLSLPAEVALDANGTINPSNNGFIFLAAGSYRVSLPNTDTFAITVPGDMGTYDVTELTTEVNGQPTTLPQISTASTLTASLNPASVETSRYGAANSSFLRAICMGEFANQLLTDTDPWTDLTVDAGVDYRFVPGNGVSGGNSSTLYATELGSVWGGVPASAIAYAYGSTEGTETSYNNYFGSNATLHRKKSINLDGSLFLDVFLIVTDAAYAHGNTQTSTQGVWLQQQLAASTAPWKIVLMHKPPKCSVDGIADAALNWPFASWGADAVIASGTRVIERITLDGGIPLIIAGLGGTSSFASFGTIDASSVYRLTGLRAAWMITMNRRALTFSVVKRSSGEVSHSFSIAPRTMQAKATLDIKIDPVAGITTNESSSAVGLYNMGVAAVMSELDMARRLFVMGQRAGDGYVLRWGSIPTATDVRSDPQLRNCLILVGDDPAVLYYWNKAASAFTALKTATADGASQYNGARTQLAAPTVTGAANGFGAICSHADTATTMWVSVNGEPFTQLSTWPTLGRVNLSSRPRPGHVNTVSAFVSRTGYIDSEITTYQVTPT